MANHVGHEWKGIDVLQGTNYLSANMDDHVAPPTVPGTMGVTRAQAGAHADVERTVVSGDHDGHHWLTFADDWYGRIHILPQSIDLGNMVSQQSRAIEVWNAFFEDRELTGIDADNLDGAILAGDQARTFAPLESYTYQLSVAQSGSPAFDGYYQFNFDAGAIRLHVVGRRVIALPFAHNWNTPVHESLAWLTDVLPSRNGREQRIRLRPHPRRRLEYSLLLKDADDRRRFHALQFGWQHRTFAIPIWTDADRLQAAAAAGAQFIPVATDLKDYDDGGLVMLWRSPSQYEIAEIDTVAANGLALKRGLLAAWASGTAVAPIRLGIVPKDIQIKGITADVESMPIALQLLAQEASVRRFPAFVAPYTYKGIDVFTAKTGYNENVEIEVSRETEAWDYQTGVFAQQSPHSGSVGARDMRLVLKDRAAVGAFLAWLQARAGKLREVWIPSWEQDFEIVEAFGAQAAAIKVKGFGYASMYAMHPARRDVVFRRQDGTLFFRRIIGAEENPDGTETISLDMAMGLAGSAASFTHVSFLKLCRLEADETTLNWVTNAAVKVAFRLRELLFTP